MNPYIIPSQDSLHMQVVVSEANKFVAVSP